MRLRNLCVMFGVLVFVLLSPLAAMAEWVTECVDCPRNFRNMSPRSLVVDSDNNPHIAYGEDHLYYAYYNGSEWRYETVDSSSQVGKYASIAFDSSGNVHISYLDGNNNYYINNNNLKYATNASGSWVIKTVDSSGDVGGYTSIAVDSRDNVHISYYDTANIDLKYTINASGLWVTEIVDSSVGSGEYTTASIAVDSSDNVHISYYGNSANGDLKYATNASGSWAIKTVDSSVAAGSGEWHTSIAVDSRDNVYISYYDSANGDLKYATNASGLWVTETADTEGKVGWYSSIAIDSLDNVHISYYDGTNKDLKYATNASGLWVTKAVGYSSMGWAGNFTSIAVDSSDNVHISYHTYINSNANGDLRYVTNASGSWGSETVDSSGHVGSYSSIAVDSGGNVHISYYDNANNDLKYATNTSGSWVSETIDNSRWSGSYTSIALDSSGNVHISYNGKYATNASGSWVTETLTGGSGHTSIALDSSDNVHISYSSAQYYTYYTLEYVTNASGSWVTETIDRLDSSWVNNDIHTSIAVDSSDNVHISYSHYDSYTDFFYYDLKYATNVSGAWVTETVDGSVRGWRNSIAVDSRGDVHISYSPAYYDLYDYYQYRNLKYATNASGTWVTETIDSNGQLVIGSIAVDSSDNLHISYHDNYAYENLKYAYYDGVSWQFETVDSGGVSLEYTSIAVDSGANVHISYSDFTHKDLKYATNSVPNIIASPASYDFGSAHKRKSSPPVTFTILNTGTADLVIDAVYLTGANPDRFRIRKDKCSARTIVPLESCTIKAIFSPTDSGTFNALIGIDSNDPDTPTLYIELTGTGVKGNKKMKGH